MGVIRIFSLVPDTTETAVKFRPRRKCLQNGHFRVAKIGQSQAQSHWRLPKGSQRRQVHAPPSFRHGALPRRHDRGNGCRSRTDHGESVLFPRQGDHGRSARNRRGMTRQGLRRPRGARYRFRSTGRARGDGASDVAGGEPVHGVKCCRAKGGHAATTALAQSCWPANGRPGRRLAHAAWQVEPIATGRFDLDVARGRARNCRGRHSGTLSLVSVRF
jgi:hypothetical protein